MSPIRAHFAALGACLLLATVLTACGDDTEPVAAPDPEPTWSRADLTGRWDVEAVGSDATSALVVGERMRLTRACGEVDAMWTVDPTGRFAGHASSWPNDCRNPDDADQEPWLADAVRVERGEGTIRLVDADGATVATLSARRSPGTAAAWTPAAPASPPAGSRPAAHEDLVGWWTTPGMSHNPGAGVDIRPDNHFSGSDGCNGAFGVWAVGADGALDVVGGPTTLVGCARTPAVSDFSMASRALVVGDEIALLDEEGEELGRLERAPSASAATTAG